MADQVELYCVSESIGESTKVYSQIKTPLPPPGTTQGILSCHSNPMKSTWPSQCIPPSMVSPQAIVTPAMADQSESLTYLVKLVNPFKKSEYKVEKWHTSKFNTVSEFKENLKQRFESLKDAVDIAFGYIEPGHGLKGRQQWINSDDEIDDMYKLHTKKKELIIWCYPLQVTVLQKRSKDESHSGSSKCTKCVEKNEQALENVKEIVSKLQLKHGNNYTPEQFNAWAQMIDIKKHQSLNDPPDYPFFRGSKSKGTSQLGTTSACSTSTVHSPSKRIHARTELLNQLMKISDLLQKGYISQEHHDKLQSDIMSDINLF